MTILIGWRNDYKSIFGKLVMLPIRKIFAKRTFFHEGKVT